MSNNYYNLFWNSVNGQGQMPAGEYSSKAEALANIDKARAEMISAAQGIEDDEIIINAGSFDVLYTGPEIVVSSIKVKDEEGDLFAHFVVRQINENGDEKITGAGEWIDYDDGLLEAVDSNLTCSGHFSREERDEIHGIVNEYLSKNPIDDDLLKSYQLAAESRQEANRYAMR